MKLFYEAVEMEISEYEFEDVITTSGLSVEDFDPDTEDKGSFEDLFGKG